MMLLYWESFANTLESFHWGFLSITPSPFSLKMTAIPTPYDYESHKMKLNGITRVIISGFPFQPWDSSMSHCISSLSILCIFPRMNTFIYHMLLKESACKSRCERHEIAGSERSGEGNGNLLQYYCLEDPMDRGARQATVYEAAESQTRVSARAHTHTDTLLVKIGVVSYLELLWVKDASVNILVIFWCTWVCILLGVYLG